MHNSSEVISACVDKSMHDLKGVDIMKLDVSAISSISDYMMIASGLSNRQVKAIANRIIEDAKNQGIIIVGVEGLEQGQWVLIDLGDVIAHVMHPEMRDYYQLEKLWAKKPEEQAHPG